MKFPWVKVAFHVGSIAGVLFAAWQERHGGRWHRPEPGDCAECDTARGAEFVGEVMHSAAADQLLERVKAEAAATGAFVYERGPDGHLRRWTPDMKPCDDCPDETDPLAETADAGTDADPETSCSECGHPFHSTTPCPALAGVGASPCGCPGSVYPRRRSTLIPGGDGS